VLPLCHVSGTAKRDRINTVLSWLPEPVAIPADLDLALDSGGVFNGGVGFNIKLWSQLVHLVAFVQAWWRQDESAREEALTDPWAWKRFIESVGGGNAPSQREALKYLAFPQTFHPIVNVSHRQQIREAYKGLLPGPPGDIDRDLLVIREKLQSQSPDKPVEFYDDPWVAAWKGSGPVTAGRHAWLVRPPTGEGVGVVQRWLDGGFIALSAAKLRTLPAGASLGTVREAVGSDYSAVEYVRQTELANGFHTFLTLMQGGDVVAAVYGDALHLGTLEDVAPWFDQADPAARLRRRVTWHTTASPLPVADLSAPLRTHLATQGTVVDLSEDLDLLLALLGEDKPEPDKPVVDPDNSRRSEPRRRRSRTGCTSTGRACRSGSICSLTGSRSSSMAHRARGRPIWPRDWLASSPMQVRWRASGWRSCSSTRAPPTRISSRATGRQPERATAR
jgi:5-methylcytosine-specific restriction enzyme B